MTPGQASDRDGADRLLPALTAPIVIADKAYDAQERVLDRLAARRQQAVIPARSNRLTSRVDDRHLYKARALIEHFFNKLKTFRAIVPRYDKTACNFLAALHLAAAVIWLN